MVAEVIIIAIIIAGYFLGTRLLLSLFRKTKPEQLEQNKKE